MRWPTARAGRVDQQGVHQSASGHHRELSLCCQACCTGIDPVLPCGAGHTRLVQIAPLQRLLAQVSLGTGLASYLKATERNR